MILYVSVIFGHGKQFESFLLYWMTSPLHPLLSRPLVLGVQNGKGTCLAFSLLLSSLCWRPMEICPESSCVTAGDKEKPGLFLAHSAPPAGRLCFMLDSQDSVHHLLRSLLFPLMPASPPFRASPYLILPRWPHGFCPPLFLVHHVWLMLPEPLHISLYIPFWSHWPLLCICNSPFCFSQTAPQVWSTMSLFSPRLSPHCPSDQA